MALEIFPQKPPQFLLQKSLISALRGSIGSLAYQNLYMVFDDKEIDILNGGQYSCGLFVSTILRRFSSDSQKRVLLKEMHSTVASTIKDMQECGWYAIEDLRPGAIVEWEGQENEHHVGFKDYHIGFCSDENHAISSSARKLCIIEHDIHQRDSETGDVRPIKAIWWHDALNS